MPDTCASYSPKAAPAFGADCKRCGRAYAEHAPITVTEACGGYVPNDLKSGGPCNSCQNCGAARDAHDWAKARAVTYPESGDYPVGNYTVSADSGTHLLPTPTVVVSGTLGRQLLQATPAEARALSTALRVAADQADADAGTDATADNTPAWLRKLDVGAIPQRYVLNPDADGKITIPKAGVWEFSTNLDSAKQRIAALYAGHRGGALEGWDGSPTTPGGGAQANRETVGAEESGESKADLHRRAWAPGNHPAAAPDAPDYSDKERGRPIGAAPCTCAMCTTER